MKDKNPANISFKNSKPYSKQFDDIYYSYGDGVEESNFVFFDNNDLPNKWSSWNKSHFVIGETGFGTGLNFLLALKKFKEYIKQNNQKALKKLFFISFEKYPLSVNDLELIYTDSDLKDLASELIENYPCKTNGCHRLKFFDSKVILDLWIGDIHDSLSSICNFQNGFVDTWFLDGFSPNKNKDMWSKDLFKKLNSLSNQHASFSTFTASSFVRRNLEECNFEIKKVKGFRNKREMLTGKIKNKYISEKSTNEFTWPLLENREVALIGGGLSSILLAKLLVNNGIKTTIYTENNTLATGASGNSQGVVYPLISPSNDILTNFFLSAFSFSSNEIKRTLRNDKESYETCGVLQIDCPSRSTKKIENFECDESIKINLSEEQTNLTSGLDINQKSIFYPDGLWVSPKNWIASILLNLKTSKLFTVKYNKKISSIEYLSPNDIRLTSDTNIDFHHAACIFTCGPYIKTFSQLENIPICPVRGQISLISPKYIAKKEDSFKIQYGKINHVLCYDGYITPPDPKSGYQSLGASYKRNNLNTSYSEKEQSENLKSIIQSIPNVNWDNYFENKIKDYNVGIRATSRDHFPFIGPLLNNLPYDKNIASNFYPNIFLFTGLGSRGLTSGPLLAEIMVSTILGEPIPCELNLLKKIFPNRKWLKMISKNL